MHQRAKTVLAAIAIAGLSVVGMDAYTYAGTGDSLILGHGNKSAKTTHVKTTGNGPALSLHAKGKRPALAVDSKAKIISLNADRVDGKHASRLQNNVRVYTASSGSSSTHGDIHFELPEFPKGRYVAAYSAYLNGAYGSVENPTQAFCTFYELGSGPGTSGGATTTSVGSYTAGISSSDVINKDTNRWSLYCQAYRPGVGYDDWSIHPDRPVRVTLTKIDETIGGKLTLARTGP